MISLLLALFYNSRRKMRNEMQKSYAFKGVCNFTKIREKILFFSRAGREFIIHSFVSSKPRDDGIFFNVAWVKNWKHLLVLAFWPKSEISEISNKNVGRAVKRNIPNKYLLRCTKSISSHELEISHFVSQTQILRGK